MNLRFFVTGASGQLGSALVGALAARGASCRAHGSELDVTEPAALEAAWASGAGGPPDVLLNAAAFTHVDRCEREPGTAERVNAAAPAGLARLCRERGVRLVHVSTDYVFDGESRRPYTEEDPPAPRSVYGRTKLAGERAVLAADPGFLVVRTSWVFGRGRNFVAAVLAQARGGAAELRVVDDQRGRPTWAVDLAEGLLALVEAGEAGLYHLAGGGDATWWEVAREALDLAGFAERPIRPIRTAELALPAPRPAWSVLDCTKAQRAGVALRDWRAALRAYLASEDAPGGPVADARDRGGAADG